LFYSFDKEKGYAKSIEFQNNANQTIIKQSWDAAAERLEAVRQQVLAGKASPIAYYMEKQLMEVPMLAAYMEIAKWRVKRHMKPGVFKKLSRNLLEKYASVLEITADQLTDTEFLKK
jgi:hypothetical protein